MLTDDEADETLMLRYVLRRIALLIPMVFAASVIIFLMLRLGTGDPALDYLRLSNLPPTPEMVASMADRRLSSRRMVGVSPRFCPAMKTVAGP